jgi:hypothetical protein
MYLNIIKDIYDKSIPLVFGKTKSIFPKVKNETSMLTIPTPVQHSHGISSQSNKAGRRNKRNTNR